MGGADADDQDATTCMGWFSRLVHYINAVEFLTPGDEELTAIAESIGSITFEHNLIIVTKDSIPASARATRRVSKIR